MSPAALARRARALGDRAAGPLLLAGCVAVAGRNLRAWRDDRAVAARLRTARAEPLPELTRTPRVSILVAAWNEAALIERHIASVCSLRYPNVEYVLCAGGADGTLARAGRRAGPGVVLLEQRAGEGKQAALRRCLERATGEVIYLTDADCVLDDASFERTIAPVIRGESEAATGGSRPLPEQLGRCLLADYVWAADAYAAARAPARITGLLGRNAAVSRRALERVGSFCADVPTGTDYHLARSLVADGAAIANVCTSEVESEFHDRLLPLARQRRRWLRNMVVHGVPFGARDEVIGSVRTSAVGLVMLVGPLASRPLGRVALSAWATLLLHSAASKVRYLAFARLAGGLPAAPWWRAAAWAVPLTLADFGIWASTLVDYVTPDGRAAW